MTTQTETIQIEGMSCGHCVAAVQRALAETEGVEVREVTVGSATVSYDPGSTPRRELLAAIEEAGFTVSDAVTG